MGYKRGDIVLVIFPDSNLLSVKRKPVLIIQANDLDTRLNQTIVAMITSNLSRAEHPSRVTVNLQTPEGKESGLKADSVIMTDNLATILTSNIDRLIGVWQNMAAVDAAIAHTFGIS